MSEAKIKIEFTPGTDIEDAFKEAIRLSRVLGCTAEFNFNGVTCWGKPNGNYLTGVNNYWESNKSKTKYKFANS